MSSRPKVCLIYTGGTIGMIQSTHGLRPPEDPSDFLRIAPELESIVELDFIPLLNKDSTNVSPRDWRTMADAVFERLGHGYAGFVIAHGTDTMHFSSSALAFAFGPDLNVPVVFTGAQTAPAVKHGDARTNLLRACKVALEDIAEVVISFGDFVFRGCRAQKKDERRFDAFESPAYYPICHITESIEITPLARYRRRDLRPSDLSYVPNFASGILQISLIPGLEPELVLPAVESERCQGVILQSFGAGNVPHEDPYSLVPVIKCARRLQKPSIITSQFPGHATLGTEYEAGIIAHEAGAIPTGNMTSAAAAVKFRWVLARVLEDLSNGLFEANEKIERVKTLMNRVYVGEMDGA